MKKANERIVNSWNKTADSDWYMGYRTDEAIQKIIDDPLSAFHPGVAQVIRESTPVLNGKRVCVPSSGDNHAVFAFHLLGARVTSCDISARQLEHAKAIADKHGWDIEFIPDNTMTLEKSGDGVYDIVFTSNGVHVWIDDLPSMYENIARVLKKTGESISYEIHPVCRPMEDCLGEIKIIKPYGEIGPYNDGMNFHWRLSDIVNAAAGAGLRITRMEELLDPEATGSFWFDEDKRAKMSTGEIAVYYDWRKNPQSAFPQWLFMRAVK